MCTHLTHLHVTHTAHTPSHTQEEVALMLRPPAKSAAVRPGAGSALSGSTRHHSTPFHFDAANRAIWGGSFVKASVFFVRYQSGYNQNRICLKQYSPIRAAADNQRDSDVCAVTFSRQSKADASPCRSPWMRRPLDWIPSSISVAARGAAPTSADAVWR